MIDIDVSTPEELANQLRKAAEKYYESTSELQSAWQDPNIKVWDYLGKILERCAGHIDKAVAELGSATRETNQSLDLDVADPCHVGPVLYDAAVEIEALDGPVWKKITQILGRTAVSADRAVIKWV